MPPEYGRTLGDVAVREASEIEGFQVITKSDLVARLGAEHSRQMIGCAEDGSCLAELAGALDAEQSIGGSIVAVDGGTLVTLTLMDMRQVTTVRTKNELLRSVRIDDLVDAVRRLTHEVITGRPLDATGTLDINVAEADTSIRVDDVEIGEGPYQESRRVAPGQHRVTVVKGEKIVFATDVRVEPAGRTTVRPELNPKLPPLPPLPWGGPYWYVQYVRGQPNTSAGGLWGAFDSCSERVSPPDPMCQDLQGVRAGVQTRSWAGFEAWFVTYAWRADSETHRSKLNASVAGGAVVLRMPAIRSLGLRLAAGGGIREARAPVVCGTLRSQRVHAPETGRTRKRRAPVVTAIPGCIPVRDRLRVRVRRTAPDITARGARRGNSCRHARAIRADAAGARAHLPGRADPQVSEGQGRPVGSRAARERGLQAAGHVTEARRVISSSKSDPARPRLLVLGRVVAGYTWRLLLELERSGVEVRALYRDSPATMAAQFAHEPGPEGDVPALNSDRAGLLEGVRFMQAHAADAIVAMGGSGNLPLLLLAYGLKRRETPVYLFTDANVPSRLGGAPRDWARHVLYRLLRPFVTEAWTLGLSNEQALAGFGLSAQRRLPLYAVDFDALEERSSAPRPAGGARIRLLCVARLSPEKNLLSLCEALQGDAVAGRFELTLVGEGPVRPALERIARASRAPIRLLGSVPRREMRGVFAQADALVLPSTWEPWGIAVVEALGLGLPVVATPRVGAAVSLADGGGVVLSDGTDPESIRRALARAADELEALRTAARAASVRVRDEFGTQAVARRIAVVLRDRRAERS